MRSYPASPERLADARVDGPVRGRSRSRGDFERREKVGPDHHVLPCGPIQTDELGIVTEPAAGAIEASPPELGLEHRPRPVERFGPANGDERGCSQRAQ